MEFVNTESVAYTCIIICCMCVTGHLYNWIEQTQIVGFHQGSLVFFYPGDNYQFQAESFILTFVCMVFIFIFCHIYFIITMSTIYLTEGRKLILDRKPNGVSSSLAAFLVCFTSIMFCIQLNKFKMGGHGE